MKVYVISKYYLDDGGEVVAVCSTLEKAKEKREQIIKEDKKKRIFADAYDINEFVVDEKRRTKYEWKRTYTRI